MTTGLKASIRILALITVWTVLPALAEGPREGNVPELSYLAVGGPPDGLHFETLLLLGNPHGLSNSGTIEFFGDDGTPLPLRLKGESKLASQVEWILSPQQSELLFLTLPGKDFKAGWLRLKASSKTPLELIVAVQIYNGESLLGMVLVLADSEEGTLSSSRRIASDGQFPVRRLRNPSAYPVAPVCQTVSNTD